METEPRPRSDEDPAIEFLARESHVPVGDVEQLYVHELAKLAVGARINSFLSIFAIRNVRKMLLNRRGTKPGPAKPRVNPVTGQKALLRKTPLPFGQPSPIKPSPAGTHEKIASS